jgi:hypothetical protein
LCRELVDASVEAADALQKQKLPPELLCRVSLIGHEKLTDVTG